ncbi:hypothetical protein P692DRAFT_20773031 [Suillus brevipes Sb2]|nr:hypothetical protein P692DRAFT_20773031 [Suillus brevipes Sb2]
MPSQLLVNQEFLNDDLDISVGDLDRAFIDTPSFGLPSSATKIISQNAAARPNHGSAVQTSIPNGYQWQMPQPGLDMVPLMMPSPITAPYFTNQPTITLGDHVPFRPLLLHCEWICCGVSCSFSGTLKELRAHCRASHFAGPKDTLIACQWKDCRYHKRGDRAVNLMRRDTIWRHTCEKHLFLKRATPYYLV